MRPLRVLDAGRPAAVLVALRAALSEGGPAVLPRDGGAQGGRPAGDGAPVEGTVAQSVALVIETSGSTGPPKRVALSADALLASAAASAGAMGGQGQWLLALPVHYVAGVQVLVRSLAAQTEPVCVEEGRFEAERFARAADRLDHDLRYTSLVPVQLARLMDAIEGGSRTVAEAVRRFDGILVGGQALDPRLRERAVTAGARILSTYGSSETAGGCVYDGAPIGTTLVREVAGTLEVSGPSLAEGYLGEPERTAAVFHEQEGVRWYRTGDLGSVVDGRVRVRGRADNVIISGGEKVLLDAVERVVRERPGYEAAVVVGAADAEWGQVPVVVVGGGTGERGVVTARGAGGSGSSSESTVEDMEDMEDMEGGEELTALRASVARSLGRAAAPSRILRVRELPRLGSGKPDRPRIGRIAAGSGDSGTEA